MLRCLFLIFLVSYQHNLISFQRYCLLRVNFLTLVFTLIFLLSFLHLISTLFSTFYKRKGRIFKCPKEKRSLFGYPCQVSFLCIPYSPPFRIVLHYSLLYLSVICWPHVCSRELIFNYLISLFFLKLYVVFSISHFFSFVSE